MSIEIKAEGFTFASASLASEVGGEHKYLIGPNDHAVIYELAKDFSYGSEPWMFERSDLFKFSRNNEMAECKLILPWRNTKAPRFHVDEVDGFFRISGESKNYRPIPPTTKRHLCLDSRTIFAFHRTDLPLKGIKISDFISILISVDGTYCGWKMRDFLQFAEFDGKAPHQFEDILIEYQALDFIFKNYCDEIIVDLDIDNEEAIRRMELNAMNESWPLASQIFRYTLDGLKEIYF